MISQLLTIFVIPLLLSLFLTPFVIRYALHIGVLDQPNERKIHKYPIPRLGGLAIYTSFFAALLLSMYFDPSLHPFSSMPPHTGVMLVISLTLVLILGIWDDVRPMTPGRKFIWQFIAATIVYVAGFRISSITHPFNVNLLNLGFLDFPVTILWIVGITNAFNLIDGLDGLASGVACIVSLTICTVSLLKGDMTTAMLALLLAGAVLGFLRYNYNGARIFLGDSGSLFIGFLLAILSMMSSTKGSAAFSILVPVLALGLPIMDTLLSMMRRLLRSIFPEQKEMKSLLGKLVVMFLPDRGHIHHQLIARGLSHKNVVLLLYVVSCVFGIGAFAVTATNNLSMTPVLITIGIATFIGVSQLRYKEMGMLRNGVLLPLYEWPILNSSIFQGFLDLGFIILAYSASCFLAFRSQGEMHFDTAFIRTLMLISGIQLGVFYVSGLYKGTFRQMGMGDLLKIFKTAILSVIITWIIFAFFPRLGNTVNVTIVILDFYFLLSFVLGVRISFHVLNYLSRRDQSEGKKKILIYGADARGALAMQQVLGDEGLRLCPVGFLDDNPHLEGKRLNGYPIFGGHWKLQRLINKMQVDEILITNQAIRPEILNRLIVVSRERGVALRTYTLRMEDLYVPVHRAAQPVENDLALAGK
jgi:UDP-GlcNAc:undecaprenyl-phosphate GlcNAc-1-phosphate transferase